MNTNSESSATSDDSSIYSQPNVANGEPKRTQSVYSRAASTRSLNVIGDDDSDKEEGKSMLSAIINKPELVRRLSTTQANETTAVSPRDDEDDSAQYHTSHTTNHSSNLHPYADTPEKRKEQDDSGTDDNRGEDDGEDGTNEDSSKIDSGFSSSNYSSNQFISASMTDSAIGATIKKQKTQPAAITSAKSLRSSRSVRSVASHKSNASQTPIADLFSGDYNSNKRNIQDGSNEKTFFDESEDDFLDENMERSGPQKGLEKMQVSHEFGRNEMSMSSGSSMSRPRQTSLDDSDKPWYKRPIVFILIFLALVLLSSLSSNIFFGIREARRHRDDFVPSVGEDDTTIPKPKNSVGKGPTRDKLGGRVIITRDDPEVKRLLNDPKLRKIFWGIDYAPLNVQYPSCGCRQRDVTLDIALLSQVTDRIRLYGTDCRQAEFVLNAFMDLDLNMTLSLGVWLDRNDEGNNRALEEMRKLVLRYPSKYIDSILVGNEVLFRQDMSEHQLIAHILATRNYLKMHNVEIPVGTSDIGSRWNSRLASAVDVLAANIHPFFGGVPVEESTSWTYQFLYEKVLADIDQWNKVPDQILISEVGWPSGGGRLWGSVAGLNEQQRFLDDWVCSKEASEKIGWYWFEAFDEPWKVIFHEGDNKWETQWGLFNSNRKLKDGLTFPTCDDESSESDSGDGDAIKIQISPDVLG